MGTDVAEKNLLAFKLNALDALTNFTRTTGIKLYACTCCENITAYRDDMLSVDSVEWNEDRQRYETYA